MAHARPRRPAWANRRAAGRAMVGIAVIGFVTAIVGTVVAWQLIGQLGANVDRSLLIGEETLITLDETIDLTEGVVTSVLSGLGTVEDTLGTVAASVGDTTELATTTAILASSIPDGLTSVQDALATLEQLGGTIDEVLRGLARIPFGPRYDPDVPLDEALAGVRQGLEPISGELRTIADELDTLAANSGDLEGRLSDLTADVAATRRALSGSAALLDQYRGATADALALAQERSDDLEADRSRSRLVAAVLGLTIALGQVVPAWVGRELLVAERARRVLVPGD